MAKQTEEFLVDIGNVVYTTKFNYISKTVFAYYIDSNQNKINLIVEESGENYVVILDTQNQTKIYITYDYKSVDSGVDKRVEYELRERIVQLEEAVESLLKIVQAQKKAIDNRVNITSFQAWTNLIEKKIGEKLIEGNLKHISFELFDDSK